MMDADGQNQRRLTHHAGWDADPDWSPDGSQIAFSSDRNGGIRNNGPDLNNIFVMDTDGGNVRQVTDTFFAQRPKWSPDGEWILYMEGEIFAIRPDGTDLWQVSEPKPDTGKFLGGWSPDGKQILYVESIGFSVNTTTPVIATLHPADPQRVFKRMPVKRPLKALDSFSFSADGKSILFRGKKDFIREGVKGDPWNIYRFGLVDKQLIQLTDSPDKVGTPQEWNPRLPVLLQELTPTRWGEIKMTK
jgi:Tol biopolymer transport system component